MKHLILAAIAASALVGAADAQTSWSDLSVRRAPPTQLCYFEGKAYGDGASIFAYGKIKRCVRGFWVTEELKLSPRGPVAAPLAPQR